MATIDSKIDELAHSVEIYNHNTNQISVLIAYIHAIAEVMKNYTNKVVRVQIQPPNDSKEHLAYATTVFKEYQKELHMFTADYVRKTGRDLAGIHSKVINEIQKMINEKEAVQEVENSDVVTTLPTLGDGIVIPDSMQEKLRQMFALKNIEETELFVPDETTLHFLDESARSGKFDEAVEQVYEELKKTHKEMIVDLEEIETENILKEDPSSLVQADKMTHYSFDLHTQIETFLENMRHKMATLSHSMESLVKLSKNSLRQLYDSSLSSTNIYRDQLNFLTEKITKLTELRAEKFKLIITNETLKQVIDQDISEYAAISFLEYEEQQFETMISHLQKEGGETEIIPMFDDMFDKYTLYPDKIEAQVADLSKRNDRKIAEVKKAIIPQRTVNPDRYSDNEPARQLKDLREAVDTRFAKLQSSIEHVKSRFESYCNRVHYGTLLPIQFDGILKANTEQQAALLALRDKVNERKKMVKDTKKHIAFCREELERCDADISENLKRFDMCKGANLSEKVPSIKCSICNTNNRDTYITTCGHTFCDACITQQINKRNRLCPACKVKIDKSFLRKINWD